MNQQLNNPTAAQTAQSQNLTFFDLLYDLERRLSEGRIEVELADNGNLRVKIKNHDTFEGRELPPIEQEFSDKQLENFLLDEEVSVIGLKKQILGLQEQLEQRQKRSTEIYSKLVAEKKRLTSKAKK